MTTLPEYNVPYDMFMLFICEDYYKVGDMETANEIANRLVEIAAHDFNYYHKNGEGGEFYGQKRNALYTLQEIGNIAERYSEKAISDYARDEFSTLAPLFK